MEPERKLVELFEAYLMEQVGPKATSTSALGLSLQNYNESIAYAKVVIIAFSGGGREPRASGAVLRVSL